MEKKRNVLIINICARNDLNITVSQSFVPQKVVKRSMGFKRPLVQIQSLGPISGLPLWGGPEIILEQVG